MGRDQVLEMLDIFYSIGYYYHNEETGFQGEILSRTNDRSCFKIAGMTAFEGVSRGESP